MYIAKQNEHIACIGETEQECIDIMTSALASDYVIEETEETYVLYNGVYMTEEQAKEEHEKEERERKSKLKMTKRDFFLYVLQPYGVTYQALNQILNSNDTLSACFNLCNHVYRYDTLLIGNIKPMLETLTGETIDEQELMAFLDVQFETHNAQD